MALFKKEFGLLDFSQFNMLAQLSKQLSADEGVLLICNGEVSKFQLLPIFATGIRPSRGE